MQIGEPRSLAHARAVRARGLALPPDGLPPNVILDSWARCFDEGLAHDAAVTVPVVQAGDLLQRRESSEFVRRLAQAELETLSRQIAGSNFLLAFADRDGVILDLYADHRFDMSASGAGIVAGSCWSESVAGTNGLGTALATGQAVAVTGQEHYFLQLGQISCTAAPVRDARGQVVGVLDASSYFESRQRHTQALVQMAATHIENGLLTYQMQGQLVLALHPRSEYLDTLSAGLLAFDGAGVLQAMNAPAQGLLVGLDARLGTHFEELFGESLDRVLARLHRGGEVRLRDALGSVLVARTVGRIAGAPPRSAGPARTENRPSSVATSQGQSLLQPDESADLLADDPAAAQACRLVEAAVALGAAVLIQGETGTGKEMLARHAHRSSGRRGEFVAVNCGALPDGLFEAELFGYAAGAFTGARRDGHEGLIAAADGGTLLLDEVGELPLVLQAALLRFLDDRVVRPVGGRAGRRVDVQLLAASNVDLEAAVRARRFREDLLYRLNTVSVTLPPLRQRRDLAAAAHAMLRRVDRSASLAPDALDRLALHSWPGNFRELQSVLTRALLSRAMPGPRKTLTAADIDAVLPTQGRSAPASLLQRSAAELVRTEYERTGHSVSQTSRNLAISRTTVYRHLRG